MGDTIGIEIEHTKYALLLDTADKAEGFLDLTTLADNQKRVLVRIFLFTEREKQMIGEIEIDNIPPAPAGTPRLHCTGRIEEGRFLVMEIYKNGRKAASSRTDLKEFRKKGGKKLWLIPVILAGATGAVLAILLAAGLLSGGNARELPVQPVETVKPAVSTETAPASREEKTGDARQIGTAEAGITETDTEQEPVEEQPRPVEQPEPPLIETETVYFAPESWALLPQYQTFLTALFNRIQNGGGNITAIEGHCALYDTEESRATLSRDRAQAVAEFLFLQGLSRENPPIVRGYGGTRPVTTEKNRQELNRRVEIIVEFSD